MVSASRPALDSASNTATPAGTASTVSTLHDPQITTPPMAAGTHALSFAAATATADQASDLSADDGGGGDASAFDNVDSNFPDPTATSTPHVRPQATILTISESSGQSATSATSTGSESDSAWGSASSGSGSSKTRMRQCSARDANGQRCPNFFRQRSAQRYTRCPSCLQGRWRKRVGPAPKRDSTIAGDQ